MSEFNTSGPLDEKLPTGIGRINKEKTLAIVPGDWMPNCSMKRIILHWTAGGHKASTLDKAHYHILIEDDGKLVRGTHSIIDNVSTGDNNYAAHTALLNTGSIGVSVCCMAEAKESPFDAGAFPMTRTQWETMAQVAADLCDFYDIAVTPQTVLGHREVEATLSKPQAGKWDPMVLPWERTLSKTQVGNKFRSMVNSKITGSSVMQETPASIQGKIFREAQIFNEKSFIKLRPVTEELNWEILHASANIFELTIPGKPLSSIPYLLLDPSNRVVDVPAGSTEAAIISLVNKFGFVAARDLATKLNLLIDWDGATRTVTIG